MRIGASISRFLRNCCRPSNKIRGSLTTAELAEHELFWIKRAQKKGMSNTNFIADQEQINLQQNKHGVLECRGRVQGDYPIYLPDLVPFTAKMVQHAHVTTLHAWRSFFDDYESERKCLGTPTAEVSQENREEIAVAANAFKQ